MSEETFRWFVAGGVALAALSFVVLAIVAVVILTVVQKLRAKVEPILESARPAAGTVREAIADLKPKVQAISSRAVEVSGLVVEEAHRYQGLSKDFAERAKVQIARLDGAVDDTIDRVQETGGAVRTAVLRPIRQVDGVFSGLRMALQTFARGKRATVNHATQDQELFI